MTKTTTTTNHPNPIIGVLVRRIPGGHSLLPLVEGELRDHLDDLQRRARVRRLDLGDVLDTIDLARREGGPRAALGGWVANAYGRGVRALRVVALPSGAFALAFAGCTCAHGARATAWAPRVGDAERMVHS